MTPNRVYVSDYYNHRVLGWADVAAFASHAAADIVIGQADFASVDCNRGQAANAASVCYPNGLAVDKLGNLYLADQSNHRILFYTQPFAAGVKAGLAASGVFGQYDSFTQNACNNSVGPDATTLCNPMGIALDTSQNLYVADHSNHRILVYRTPQAITSAAGSGDSTADQVLGQLGSFLTAIPNVKGVDAEGLNYPSDVALDNAGNLYVADHSNSRVLKYNKPLSSGNTTADQVLGQPDMASNTPNYEGSVTRRGLYNPFGVAVNGAGSRLFISDRDNNRVLLHTNPGTDAAADQVIGQNGSFTNGNCNMDNPVSAKSLCRPTGIALDGPGSLHVADTANNRVTKYKATVTSATPATGVLGQDQYTSNLVNSLDGRGFNGPTGIAIDRSVSPNRVYLADYGNNRVLGWSDIAAFVAKAPATIVIGQTNLYATACNQSLSPTAKTLCNPLHVAVDTAGNLFVVDYGNQRVLRYQYLRHQSGSLCVDSADFGGLENPVIG